MPNPKELTEEQIQILKRICEDGTLDTLATVEAGFASWGHANHLGKEVVRLAQMVNALSRHIVKNETLSPQDMRVAGSVSKS